MKKLLKNIIIAKLLKLLIDNGPDRFCSETFISLDGQERFHLKNGNVAARQLYQELKELREDYKKKYGKEPVIRILAHSHGGNVALLLERVKDKDDTTFAIDELILLAVPVQTHTMYYTHAPYSKKYIHFIQCLMHFKLPILKDYKYANPVHHSFLSVNSLPMKKCINVQSKLIIDHYDTLIL